MDLGMFQGIYCGPAPDPADLWTRWNFDPALIASLTILAVVVRRDAFALAGVAVLGVAFVSPLCALSSALFSARVLHHALLIGIAAPLFAASRMISTPRSPVVPLIILTSALWFWHLPVAYDAALGNMALYWVMQASLLVAALLFWQSVLNIGQRLGSALMAILGAYLQMALLGALLTFAPETLYAIHATAPTAFGLSPLSDQQLGGLIMWVPAGLPFLIIAALVTRRGLLSLRFGTPT
jgi:putative membrane protein